MKKKVYLALAHKTVENYLIKELSNEVEFIGSAVYREGILEGIKKQEPDILIIRETLPGKIDLLEIVDYVRVQCKKHVQIIVVTGNRVAGDELLSALVRYSVFDLVVGDKVNVKEICNLVRNPNVYKDVSMYAPKVKIDEKTKKQLFELPQVPKVIEKEVIREVIIDHTNVIDSDAANRTAEEYKRIEQERKQLENAQREIQQEKAQILKQKEDLSILKKELEDKYDSKQRELEHVMSEKMASIDKEKSRLIELEKVKVQKELKSAQDEIERVKLEAERIIDEEKRKIHKSKQAQMEKDIEILRVENAKKIKELEQAADKQIQLEQEKYTQMQLDEIEKYKLEKAKLEEKYNALKEKDKSERAEMEREINALKENQRLLQEQRESDLQALKEVRLQLEKEKSVKGEVNIEVSQKLKKMEETLREKEDELEQEKEILEVKYSSIENSLFAKFDAGKKNIESEAKKRLEISRNSLKNMIHKELLLQKQNYIAQGVTSEDELSKKLSNLQQKMNKLYNNKLQEVISSIKSDTAKKLKELELSLLEEKKREASKFLAEKQSIDDEKESLRREIEVLLKEKNEMGSEYKQLEKSLLEGIAKKEESLNEKRLLLEQKESELNRRIKEFSDEAKITKPKQEVEKENELEDLKRRLLEEKCRLENHKLELEDKFKKENEHLQSMLAKLEEEKQIILKMKTDATIMSSGSMSKNVLTFLGCKSGVGTTTVAFNTAVALAKEGKKILYVDLNKDFSGISYAYKLGFYDSGIDFAINQISESQYDAVLKNIVSIKDVKHNTSKEDIMFKNYKKMPSSLNCLFYSGRYYAGYKEYNQENFKDLMMFILMKLSYDYVIFDVNMNMQMTQKDGSAIDSMTEEILKFSSKIYFTITQDMASVGACLQVRKLMRRAKIAVDDFRFVLNRYNPSAKLSKKAVEDWLKVDIKLSLLDKNKEVVDSNYVGLPLVLYTKDKEITKFYNMMVADILKVTLDIDDKKKKRGR